MRFTPYGTWHTSTWASMIKKKMAESWAAKTMAAHQEKASSVDPQACGDLLASLAELPGAAALGKHASKSRTRHPDEARAGGRGLPLNRAPLAMLISATSTHSHLARRTSGSHGDPRWLLVSAGKN